MADIARAITTKINPSKYKPIWKDIERRQPGVFLMPKVKRRAKRGWAKAKKVAKHGWFG